jgi:hypothetical protein
MMTTAHKIDEAAINAAACRNLNPILARLMDCKGYASDEVTRLGGRAEPIRLTEYRVSETGAWRALSNPDAHGQDLVSFVQFLGGGCDRETATTFLAGLVERQQRAAA